jgi:O-antigen/teichoic acid export membrane protein
MLRSVFGASVGSVLANVVRVLLSFGSTVMAARLLGLEQFGVASALLAQSVFIHYLLTLGLDQTLPAEKDSELVDETAVLGIAASFLVGTLVTLLLAWGYFDEGRQFSVGFLLLWQAVFSALGAIVAGVLRFRSAYVQLILKDQILFPTGVFLSSSLLLWLSGGSLLVYASGYATSAICLFVAWLIYFRIDLRRALGRLYSTSSRMTLAITTLKRSAPVGVLSLVEIGTPWAILVVVSWRFTADEVGLLALFIRYGALCTFIAMALGPLVAGALPKLHFAAPSKLAGPAQEVMRVSAAGALAMGAGMLMFLDELSGIAGVADIQWMLFSWVLLAFVLDGALALSKFVIITAGDRVAYLLGSAGSLVLASMTALLPVFRDGAVAGSVALLVGALTMIIVRIWLVKRACGFSPIKWKDVLRLSVLALPTVALAVVANASSWSFSARILAILPSLGILAVFIWRSLEPEGFFRRSSESKW